MKMGEKNWWNREEAILAILRKDSKTQAEKR